jgi:hypothetical protein
MALNISITQPNPAVITPNQPYRFSFTIENGGASPVTLTGISVIDKYGLSTIGSFGPTYPADYQVVSGGSPVTSSIPAWGTATQSNTTYYVGNISGSSLQRFQTSGSYGGNNVVLNTPASSSVIIPAGATGSYVGSAVVPFTTPFTDFQADLKTLLQVQVFEEGVVQPTTQDAPSDLFFIPALPVAATLSLVDQPLQVITRPPYARNPIYADFDVALQTSVLLSDGTNWILPVNNSPFNNFTSSDPSVISVVNTGPYVSTTPSTSLTNSVGSIYGGQFTQLSGGAGACSFDWANVPDSPQGVTTTISNELAAGLTASIDITLAQYQVVGLEVVPNLLSIQSGSGGNTYDLEAYYITAQGGRFSATEVGQQPNWSSNNPTAVPVSVSGTLTASVNTQANVTITAELPQLGSSVIGSANVILNYIP